MVGTTRVLIGICTFRRPDYLRRLLDAIDEQLPIEGVARPVVLVVDNDPAASADWVALRPSPSIVHLEHVGAKNIAIARNHVLDFALKSDPPFELLAMIDDDELPAREWLGELVSCWRRCRADIVIGPVFGTLPDDAPAWIRDGGYFDHVSPVPDGPLLEGISGNAMLVLSSVRREDLRFDTNLGRSGGEDQLFFRLAAKRGLALRYAARALVTETVPADRCSVRYLAARGFRMGNTLGLLDAHLPTRSWRQALLRFVKSFYWTFSGFWRAAGHCRIGMIGIIPGLLRSIRGLGMAAGLVGIRYDFYSDRRNIHAKHGTSGGDTTLRPAGAPQSQRASGSPRRMG